MELLNETEINVILKQLGLTKTLRWHIENYSEKLIGNLGDHLKLIIEAEKDGLKTEIKLFVKCMPRFDKWKFEYLQECKFFEKEFTMLSKLFRNFQNGEGFEKWRPKLLFIKNYLFVFEDLSELGYKMPHHQCTMTFDALKATVKTLARFHAQSFIYEERQSKELGKPYRIWDDFSEYLQEPDKVNTWRHWRDTGRKAVVDFIKEFSKDKLDHNFINKVEYVMPILYDRALALTKPSTKYRNVVIHRDLWSNNILIKEEKNCEPHVLIIDFQTVLYAPPMHDLSALIYFNTTRASRDKFSIELINIYYDTLAMILQKADVNINSIFPISDIMDAYNDSLAFGMIQASIILPIVSMSSDKREEIFGDPGKSKKANVVSRSEEFIDIAKEDPTYYNRVKELIDEIVEKYIIGTGVP